MPTIQKSIQLAATPERVFAALTDPGEFSKLTSGAPAALSAEAGAEFSLFGGMIEGRNVECDPGKRLVQAWRPKTWEPGTYSLVKFELTPDGGGTRLSLEHTGFPPDQQEHLSSGWDQNYLTPLTRRFPGG